jgi:type I restriction enzyme S subunit
LREHVIPLAPLAEQRRIVAEIETQLTRLDASVAALKRAQANLKRYRAAVLKAACEGRLVATDHAQQGCCTTLGELSTLITSGSRGWASYYSDEGAIFIRAQDIKTDRLRLETAAFVTIPSKAEGSRTRVKQHDLLITITGANVTKTALVEQDIPEAYVSQHVGLVRPVQAADPKFLYYWIISPSHGRRALERSAYGAGKPGLNLTDLRNLRVELPPLAEQHRIVEEVERRLSVVEEMEKTVAHGLKRAERLRQAILRKAFAGELAPQDPADEPASVLLERIRAERAGTAKPKRARSREGQGMLV